MPKDSSRKTPNATMRQTIKNTKRNGKHTTNSSRTHGNDARHKGVTKNRTYCLPSTHTASTITQCTVYKLIKMWLRCTRCFTSAGYTRKTLASVHFFNSNFVITTSNLRRKKATVDAKHQFTLLPFTQAEISTKNTAMYNRTALPTAIAGHLVRNFFFTFAQHMLRSVEDGEKDGAETQWDLLPMGNSTHLGN